jgi:signal transduction histidine kinase
LAKEKGLRYEVRVDDEMPVEIVGDADRLKQIALNLISNALKFTEAGHVLIDVSRDGKYRWTFSVKDSGIGIPSHAQEYIFEEFRQVDGSWQRKHGGSGLGLAIVRNMTLMMGGTVRVRSEVGKGSTFTVLLPLNTTNESMPTLG